MKCSVIIPTCHRNDLLAKCLERLCAGMQALEAGDYEVIVTDDGAKSDARQMIEERFPWAKWVKGPGRGPASNRNRGASHARGEWLLFLDDDCVPDTGLLAAFAAEAAGNNTRVIEGRIYPDRPRQNLAEIAPLNESGGYLWSCNFAIKKELFDAMGGFDERFPYASMEDVDFRLRLERTGEKIKFVHAMSASHPWRIYDSRKEFSKYEESLAIYLAIHPDEKKHFTAMAQAMGVLRTFLKGTLPGIWRCRGAGLPEVMTHHFFSLRLALKPRHTISFRE